MTQRWIGALTFAFAITLSSVAIAQAPQSNNYLTIEAISNKPVQVGYYATATKECSPDPAPTIQVTEAPRSGILIVRKGVLTTNRVAGCPGLKTPAQVVFYQARAGYSGTDHVVYRVTNADGEASTYDVSIEIKQAAPAPSNGGGI